MDKRNKAKKKEKCMNRVRAQTGDDGQWERILNLIHLILSSSMHMVNAREWLEGGTGNGKGTASGQNTKK